MSALLDAVTRFFNKGGARPDLTNTTEYVPFLPSLDTHNNCFQFQLRAIDCRVDPPPLAHL